MANLEGKKAPAFSLDGNDGKKHSLDDYKGKAVVLYFYPRDDTPGCTKEACGFRDQNAALKKSGVVGWVSARTVSNPITSSPASQAAVYSVVGSQSRSDEKIRRLGQETDVRQGSAGDDPLDGSIGPKGDVVKHWTAVKKAGIIPRKCWII